MKCILHIGTEKTGTTILQDWLYYNHQILSNRGVYLSQTIGKNNNREIVSYFMDDFDGWFKERLITNESEKNRYFKDFQSVFLQEVKKAKKNHEVMVITSEHFHSRLRKPELISNLKKFLDQIFDEVSVICYFRKQSDMRKSLYSTALKNEIYSRIEDFHSNIDESNYYYNFYEIATKWSSVFGVDNCIFKVYDRKYFTNGDLRVDFLESLDLNINKDDLNYDIISANESLSYLESIVYRVINEEIRLFNPNGRGINLLNRKLKQAVKACRLLKKGKIVDTQAFQVDERFKKSNEKFFETYFNDVNLFENLDTKADIALFQKESELSIVDVGIIIEELLTAILKVSHKDDLVDADASILRDIALKYESQEVITKEDAYYLMRLANKARPKGAFIIKKLKEYSR